VIDDNRVVPPLEFFTHAPQPAPDTPVWRLRPLKYFRDIVQKREFHFARADQVPQDDEEGIPPDEYIAAVRAVREVVAEFSTGGAWEDRYRPRWVAGFPSYGAAFLPRA
jgi:hypothetical protein